jgi:voltage-dependent anion channel protein 2
MSFTAKLSPFPPYFNPVTDHLSAQQAKINDRGIAALAYNVKLGTGATLGLGASLDTQNLNQASHKVGASFTFEG